LGRNSPRVGKVQSSKHQAQNTHQTCLNTAFSATLSRMARRHLLSLLLIFTCLALTSCSASLFKIKPATEVPPSPGNRRRPDAGGGPVSVARLLTDEESQELFEANLPLSGILPLRVELLFQSGVPVEIKRGRFKLRDNQNREWKFLSAKS